MSTFSFVVKAKNSLSSLTYGPYDMGRGWFFWITVRVGKDLSSTLGRLPGRHKVMKVTKLVYFVDHVGYFHHFESTKI